METFWKWLFKGAGASKPGIRNILNKYLIVHGIIGVISTYLIAGDPFLFASKALFPAASILIGISIAWTTRAYTVLQVKEFREAIFTANRPAEDYIYGFQLSILVVMIMVIYVAIMAGGGVSVSVFGPKWDKILAAFWLYSILSLALRECWGVINFTNMLSMLEYRRPK